MCFCSTVVNAWKMRDEIHKIPPARRSVASWFWPNLKCDAPWGGGTVQCTPCSVIKWRWTLGVNAHFFSSRPENIFPRRKLMFLDPLERGWSLLFWASKIIKIEWLTKKLWCPTYSKAKSSTRIHIMCFFRETEVNLLVHTNCTNYSRRAETLVNGVYKTAQNRWLWWTRNSPLFWLGNFLEVYLRQISLFWRSGAFLQHFAFTKVSRSPKFCNL